MHRLYPPINPSIPLPGMLRRLAFARIHLRGVLTCIDKILKVLHHAAGLYREDSLGSRLRSKQTQNAIARPDIDHELV